MKVLLLEHEDEVRDRILKQVRARGIEIQAERDGLLGLEAASEYHPDVMLVDLQLPIVNGLGVLSKIRRVNKTCLFILITAPGYEKHALKGLKLGANNYLKKPIDPDALMELLDKYRDIFDDKDDVSLIKSLMVRRTFSIEMGNQRDLVPKIVHQVVQEAGDAVLEDDCLEIELGLTELITNAIEHGNLGITGEEKRKALETGPGKMDELVKARMANPDLAARRVRVDFSVDKEGCDWTITDQGAGFDWTQIQDPTQDELLMVPHGRGIFLSRLIFSELTYMDRGNVVRARKNLGDTGEEPEDQAATTP